MGGDGDDDDRPPREEWHLALAAAAAAAREAAAIGSGKSLSAVCSFPRRGEAPLLVDLGRTTGGGKAAQQRWWARLLSRRPAPRPPPSIPAASATPAVAAATAAAAAALLRDDSIPKHAPTYATLEALVGCGAAGGGGPSSTTILTARSPDAAWRAARRAAAPCLGPVGVTTRWEAVARACQRAAALVTPGADGATDVDELCTRAALDAAAGLIYGVDARATAPPGAPGRARADALLSSLAAGLAEVDARWVAAAPPPPPPAGWWGTVRGWAGPPAATPPPPPPPPTRPEGDAALATFHACVRALVDASLAAAGEGGRTPPPPDTGGAGPSPPDRAPPAPAVVELARRGAPGGGPLPRPALDAHAAALTLAGTDAAGHAVGWAVALLAAHPAAAACAEAELAAGGWLGGGSETPLEPLRAADVAPSATGGGSGGRLPFLRACLLEAVRLFPPAPAAVREGGGSGGGGGRASGTESAVVISPHAWHRCPAHFGSPATFLPERWLVDGAEWMGGGGGGGGGDGCPRRWRRFAPFGEGARACPGAALATAFGVSLLASLVGRFRWRLVVDGGDAGGRQHAPAALVAHLHTRVAATAVTLAPAGGLWVVAEER